MKPRYYLAAPDATPDQIALGRPYAKLDEAQRQADAWNMRRPQCPIVIWKTGGVTPQGDLFA